MSEKKKNLAKLVGLLLALLGGAAGADEAGIMPELDTVEKLGIVGAGAIILYLHSVWYPLVKAMRADSAAMREQLGAIATAIGVLKVEAAPVAEPPVVVPPKRAETHPGLKVVKPARDP